MALQSEWDVQKSASSWFKHRVRFETAEAVFDNAYAILDIDETEVHARNDLSLLEWLADDYCPSRIQSGKGASG